MSYQAVPTEFPEGMIDFSIILSARLAYDPEMDALARRLVNKAESLLADIAVPLLRYKCHGLGTREKFIIMPQDAIIDDGQGSAIICSAAVATVKALSFDCVEDIIAGQVFDAIRRDAEEHFAEVEAKAQAVMRGVCMSPMLAV